MKKSPLALLALVCLAASISLIGCGKSDKGTTESPTAVTKEQPSQTNSATPTPGTESVTAQTTTTAATTPAPVATPAPTPTPELATTTSTITAADAKVTCDFIDQLPKAQVKPVVGWVGKVAYWTPTINHAHYRGIVAHAPAQVAFTGIAIDQNSVLEFAPILDPQNAAGSDGVVFTVTVKTEGGEAAKVFERELNPGTNEEDRQLKAVDVPLKQFAGKTVEIQFATDNKPEKHNYADMAVFVDPKIIDKPGVQGAEPAKPAAEEKTDPKSSQDDQAKTENTGKAGSKTKAVSQTGSTKSSKRKSKKQN